MSHATGMQHAIGWFRSVSSSQPIHHLHRILQKDGVFDGEEASFEFRKQKFVYSEAENTFFKLRFPVQVRQEQVLEGSGFGDNN